MRNALTVFIAVISVSVFSSMLVNAWTGPAANPPASNIGAPILTGTVAQTKSASLGLNGLAVFGNTILQASAYLNWGSTSGSSGYGIRDNAGTLELKNSAGSWASIPATISALIGTSAWATSTTNMYNSNAGNVGIGQNPPSVRLDVARANDSLVNVQTTLGSNAIGVSSTYGAGSNFVAGPMWRTTDNNPTKPKAGVWMYQDGTGSFIQFGTSNSYVTGITNQALTINPAGNVGVGVTSPATTMEIAANTALKLGNAYLSSGGDYVHLANNEWYNGSAWTTNGSAGELLQLTGQAMNVYSHDNAGVHTLRTQTNSTGFGIFAAPNTGLQLGAGGDGLANGLTIYSTYPTVYFRHAAGYNSAAIHVNSNLMYFMSMATGNPSGGNNWTTPANGYYPWYINLTNNDSVFGGRAYGFNFYYVSDRNLKESIQPLDSGLATLMKLRPVSFNWKKGAPMAGTHDIGFIAQDVEQILPDIVHENDKGQKAIDYVRLTPLLVNAIQEQERELDKMEADAKAIKSKL